MFKHIKKITKIIISKVQKVILAISLFILYMVGFGATLFFLIIFNRKALVKEYESGNSYWHKACGYELDNDESLRQA